MGVNREVGPIILIIHEDKTVARFFEGVLRNGFHPKVFASVHDAVKSIEAEAPDLILCDINCLADDAADAIQTLGDRSDAFSVPVILISEDRPEEKLRMLALKSMDCVPRSVNPSLLRWKIKAWLNLKRDIDRNRESGFRATERACRLESQLETLLHDMRSPVMAIRGLVDRLKRNSGPGSSKAQREATIEVLDNVSRSLEDFLVDSSKTIMQGLDAVEWEPVRLDEVAIEVIHRHQQLIEDNGIQVQTDTIVGHPVVIGSRRGIRQVLDNLVLNAIKHMGERPDPCITISMAENGTFVVTRIHDNGIGIPDQYLDNVFDRFFRVPGSDEVPGSGLGLSIVKQIVESHQGKVWVDSGSGHGATFSFALPKYCCVERSLQS